MKRALKISLGITTSLVGLWLAFRGFDFATLRQEAAAFNTFWIFPAVLFYLGSFTLRIFRWKLILNPVKKIPLKQVGPSLIIGFLLNTFLPARMGEIGRSITISKKADIPLGSALGSVVTERLMDMFGMLIMMLIAANEIPWERLPLKTILPLILLLAGMMLVATFYFPKLKGSGSAFVQKIISFIKKVTEGFSIIKNPRKLSIVALLSILVWSFEASSILVLSKGIGLNLTLTQAPALMIGIAFGVMIPAAPGYVGTYEFFGKQTLIMLGFAASSALTFVLMLHFFQICMIVLMGLPSLIMIGGKVKQGNQ